MAEWQPEIRVSMRKSPSSAAGPVVVESGSMTGRIETAHAKEEAPTPPLYFGSNSGSGDQKTLAGRFHLPS